MTYNPLNSASFYVSTIAQLTYECTICYETFDETHHRPLTLICNEEDNCGHTYCLKCVTEISKMPDSKCPACNACIQYSITNWFVIDLIKTITYDIDNPYLDVLVEEMQRLELQLSQYKKKVAKMNKENEDQSQVIKSKIDSKMKEANNQLKSVECNLIIEFLNLKNYHEKTLNECKKFEDLIQEKISIWNKKLGSLEYRRDSSKLENVQNEIEIDLAAIKQMDRSLSQFVPINKKISFEPNQFKFPNDLLGSFKESDQTALKRRAALGTGCRMILTGLWYILCGIYFSFFGLVSVLIGTTVWLCQSMCKSFDVSKYIQFKLRKWRKTYKLSVDYNENKSMKALKES